MHCITSLWSYSDGLFVSETLVRERTFNIYLGGVPEDVVLVSIQLNGREFTLPLTNMSTYKVTEVLHPNGTHGYTLTVLFDDPIVKLQVIFGINTHTPPPYFMLVLKILKCFLLVLQKSCGNAAHPECQLHTGCSAWK